MADGRHARRVMRSFVVSRQRELHRAAFCGNAVQTTKYTALTFVPKFLFEQLSRVANAYMLLIVVLQQIPGVTATNRFGTALTLTAILVFTAAKELYEDARRRAADAAANDARTQRYVHAHGAFEDVPWRDLAVGDVVRVREGEAVPADIVLLRSSLRERTPDDQGGESAYLAYVQTASIDGESALKVRRARPLGVAVETMHAKNTLVRVSPPTRVLDDFWGAILCGDTETPLGPGQLLLRGCVLRNTEYAVGVVAYTGTDTKLVMNSAAHARIKRSSTELLVSRHGAVLFAIIVCLAIAAVACSAVLRATGVIARHAYLGQPGVQLRVPLVLKWLATHVVILHSLFPTSLVLTMEIVRIYLGAAMEADDGLRCSATGISAVARTTTLVEELGRVQYVFTDKTGTLTRNEMVLRFVVDARGAVLAVPRVALVHSRSDSGASSAGRDSVLLLGSDALVDGPDLSAVGEALLDDEMLLAMAACNTAVVAATPMDVTPCTGLSRDASPFVHLETLAPVVQTQTLLAYQSPSPDEVAIVEGAHVLGLTLVARTTEELAVHDTRATRAFSVLAVLEFSSARKRMGVVLRDSATGNVILLVKGADSSVLPLLSAASARDSHALQGSLDGLAARGLRTLVYAWRTVPAAEWAAWLPLWRHAHSSLADGDERAAAIAELCARMERDLVVAGGTAVEDVLRDHVPETIARVRAAGARLWVLTGDKLETAVAVSHSCGLVPPDADVVSLRTATDLASYVSAPDRHDARRHAVVIDTDALEALLEAHGNTQDAFLQRTAMASAVVCCRCSPLQKTRAVQTVQGRAGAVCLAIGDGANDVGMIQAADVGVGIATGREGTQAARAADFAIAEFHMLARLMLVHGAWGYNRMGRTVAFTLYKNAALYGCQLVFQVLCLVSGQTVFESWSLSGYNVIFTFFLPLLIGTTEKFVSSRALLNHPQTYALGPASAFMNATVFWQALANGLGQALFASAAVFLIFSDGGAILPSGRQASSLFFIGTTLYAAVLLAVTLKTALVLTTWRPRIAAGLFAGPCAFVSYLGLYEILVRTTRSPAFADLAGLAPALLSAPVFYAVLGVVVPAVVVRDFAWRFYRREFRPLAYHALQDMERREWRLSRTISSAGAASV